MPTFREALRFWIKLGFVSFGGPAGQIALMHRELVDRRRWVGEGAFLHALNFCMLLPGPEAQQLATYLGWRLHGTRGGIVAGALFVLPSMFILYGLSWLYLAGGHLPWLAAIFHGLMPAVIAIVAGAMLRMGRKSLKTPALVTLAVASFVAIHFFSVSFVVIIAVAALFVWAGSRLRPDWFPSVAPALAGEESAPGATQIAPSWGRAARITVLCLVLWWLPILLVGLWLGWDGTAFRQGVFFSKAALVTFGGAYAVLPYVAQQAVETHAWLSHEQMMAGLALAETTPGPLIMVLQFVGFAGGWQHPGELSPIGAATLGAFITTWATFLPCFLFVFLGAPHVDHLRRRPRLGAALMGITAAVVGVIGNLGVTFARQALWPESGGGLDGFVLVVAVAAFVAMERFRVGDLPVIGACAAIGLAWGFLP